MLIDSPRLTAADRAAWDRLAAYDAILARDPALARMADRARGVIAEFAAAGPCYASTSWGKDSTVAAHLLATSGVDVPLVWVRVDQWENPDCLLVRDAFLSRYDHIDYHEITTPATSRRWWDPDDGTHTDTSRTLKGGFAEASRRFGARHISGIRGEESRIRRIVQARWGDAGPSACRPLGRWDATHVFAWLHAHDLPVHPAYAMSIGGVLDRRWLRVSSIGGVRGADKGRAEWECRYYPDIVPAHAGGHA
ncbi:phosphoadenosine phosphosulfate reductase family protein [Phytoactinopolyspora limicola]|uniref:phosphoadenosine phosphosulfate reductase domain-containing protein n=1 Tax=Phytoactinopolyspora limicola TaxID=2715536 RepID=UPI00140A016B|nr:phosphoadenosine phosphosulfate reductase family protein [Phytoactinopolyspora limicola]